mmetsp:Transcript_43401/g.112909  ORF Transcript_43401/g.112909 Transcript_43401/m.112909 type:complete len:112 (-) Transcript_43401:1164-1499(-)
MHALEASICLRFHLKLATFLKIYQTKGLVLIQGSYQTLDRCHLIFWEGRWVSYSIKPQWEACHKICSCQPPRSTWTAVLLIMFFINSRNPTGLSIGESPLLPNSNAAGTFK